MWRINLLLEYVLAQPPHIVIIIMDGYDVLVTAHATEILSTFHSFGSDLVFSASYPERGQPRRTGFFRCIKMPLTRWYFECTTNHILCCGTMMGRAHALARVLRRLLSRSQKTGCCDDQANLNNISLDDLSHTIDQESKLMWVWETLYLSDLFWIIACDQIPEETRGIETFRIKDMRRIRFSRNGTQPCIVHGTSNRCMDRLASTLR